VCAVGLVWLASPTERLHRSAVSATPSVGSAPRGPSPMSLPAPPGAPSETEPVRTAHAERVEAVVTSCGLPVRTWCEGERCVALTIGPDLDRITGWAELVLDSPRFVLSTALRDVGVPTGALPCGGAIAGLVPGGSVPAIELADGTEVWCAAEPDSLALCDAAAQAELGPEAVGFTAPDVRRLSFARNDG
jgi:hypothetical protein